eukprot:1145020-Pelagomonas_calceolata.AAC.2
MLYFLTPLECTFCNSLATLGLTRPWANFLAAVLKDLAKAQLDPKSSGNPIVVQRHCLRRDWGKVA